MSKIGKKIITIPSGITVTANDGRVMVKGPKGELTFQLPLGISVKVESGTVAVSVTGLYPPATAAGHSAPLRSLATGQEKQAKANWGLSRAIIQNMITGVSQGFQKVLEFNGVGYKAIAKGKDLELNLGFSHPILFPAPAGIEFNVEKNTILKISGTDKELVGSVAAQIRALKEPEPYKGHGIKYSDEVIHKKAGKKAVASGGAA